MKAQPLQAVAERGQMGKDHENGQGWKEACCSWIFFEGNAKMKRRASPVEEKLHHRRRKE
jgi:hypothetical protein